LPSRRKRHIRVETDFFITDTDPGEVKEDEYIFDLNPRLSTNVSDVINNTNFDDDDLHALRALLEVGNDYDPVPENIPDPNENNTASVYANEWGHTGVCHSQKTGVDNNNPKIITPPADVPLLFDLWEYLFQRDILPMLCFL
jgi:hypothetical protein